LGACGYAPMMQLGEHYKEHLTPEKIDAIVDEYRKKSGALN
jgi:NADH-quinone oxidoreductase subunit E